MLPSKILQFGKKKLEYYDDLLIRADNGLHEQIATAILTRVPKGATVLDMGAGQGALAARLSDMGYDVTAVDVNVDDYKGKERGIHFEELDFDEPSALDNYISNHSREFDVVCGVEVIEHVENPWMYIRGLTKMVKKGGLVLVTTPNVTSWLSRLNFLRKGTMIGFEAHNLKYGHINPITPFELKLIMERCGLKQIELSSGGTMPPLYMTSVPMAIVSLFALVLRPFQKGVLNGWCVIATGLVEVRRVEGDTSEH